MGVVYRALDTKLDRQVALKFLPNHLLGDEEIRKRFEREAKAAAALSHANVCTVYEIDSSQGQTFIAMELVEGEPLDQKIARGPLKLEEALNIAQQIAKGLEAAHRKDVVHRDIKPQNIMIGDDNQVTIMDFGLAQLTQASRLTRTDQTMGTTAYMSPEQTEASGTDHRTDIWALGVVLYEMVTGQQPFRGDYDKAIMYSILNEEPEPMTALRTGVPMELEIVVNKCLAKDATARYQRADELLVDIRSLSRATATAFSVPALHPASPPTTEESTGSWIPQLRVVSAGLVVLAMLALIPWLRTGDSPAERPLRKFSLSPPGGVSSARISPDGRSIAYQPATPGLSILSLESGNVTTVPEAVDAMQISWAPDNLSLAFHDKTFVRVLSIRDYSVSTLIETPFSAYSQGTWTTDSDAFVFALRRPDQLVSIPRIGGQATPVTASDGQALDGAVPLYIPRGNRDPILLYFRDGGGFVAQGSTGILSSFSLVLSCVS